MNPVNTDHTERVAQATDDIAGLQFAIAHAEEQAQNAEDRERYNLASNWRAKARELKARLNCLLGR